MTPTPRAPSPSAPTRALGPAARRTAVALASALALGLAAGGPGCATGRPGAPLDETAREPTTLERAQKAIDQGDLQAGRRHLEEHLEDEPDDAQARYLLARTLAALGEARGARAEVRRALELQPQNPLALGLLAALEEELGEHRAALDAWVRVQRTVPEALDPLLGVARNLVFLGRPDAALLVLDGAPPRYERDASRALLRFQALRRADRPEDAAAEGRRFLDVARDVRALAREAAEVRRWLAEHPEPLDTATLQALVDAVRAGLRMRLPSSEPPEDEVLRAAPERLHAFDERPVFVTARLDDGRELRGRGRGRSLAAATKGAIVALQERPGFTPYAAREAPVRVELGQALEPVALRAGPGGVEATPRVVPGLHGLGLRVGERELIVLPSDAGPRGLVDLAALLARAGVEAGLGPEAWREARGVGFRFEVEGVLSPGPGLAPVRLRRGEPLPLPEGDTTTIEPAAAAAAAFLLDLLDPDRLALGPGRTLAGAPLAGEGADLGPAAEALAAVALARAGAALGRPGHVGAARALAARVARRLEAGPDAGAAPWAPDEAALAAARAVEALALATRATPRGAPAGGDGAADDAKAAEDAEALAARLRARLDVTPAGALRWPAASDARALGGPAGDPGGLAVALQRADRTDAGVEVVGPAAGSADDGALDEAPPAVVEAVLRATEHPRRAAALARARREAAAQLEPLAWGRPARMRAARVRLLAAAVEAARAPDDVAAFGAGLRAAVADLLALQLAPRHQPLLPGGDDVLGAFRREPVTGALACEDTADALDALTVALATLRRTR